MIVTKVHFTVLKASAEKQKKPRKRWLNTVSEDSEASHLSLLEADRLAQNRKLSVAYLGFGKGGHGERAEREPIMGSGSGAPSGVQGQSAWSGVSGAKPP